MKKYNDILMKVKYSAIPIEKEDAVIWDYADDEFSAIIKSEKEEKYLIAEWAYPWNAKIIHVKFELFELNGTSIETGSFSATCEDPENSMMQSETYSYVEPHINKALAPRGLKLPASKSKYGSWTTGWDKESRGR